MIETKEIICIGCPMGCPVILEHEGQDIKKISGNECKRGSKYAVQEFSDPRRSISTTVAISNALWQRLPVKITAPVQKDRVIEAAKIIHTIHVSAPIKMGQILLENLFDEPNVHVIATRSMNAIK